VPRSERRPEIFGSALGLFATIAQVVLMREALTVAGGNELAVGLDLGAWLTGVGLGALIAAPLPRPSSSLIGAAVAAGPISAVGLMILRLNRAIFDLSPGADPTIAGLATALACGLGLGGLSVGFSFTAAARSLPERANAPVSRLYVAEALGALVAGLLFTFVLAGTTPPLVTLGASSALLTGAGAAVSDRRGLRALGGVTAAALAVVSLLLLPDIDHRSQLAAFERLGAGKQVATAESAYGRLALGQSEDQYQLLADSRVDYSFPDPWERAPAVHLALTQHPSPRSVLLVGGGAPDVLEAALSHGPHRVVLTYLDERIHELCRPFWPRSTVRALGDPRIEVVRDDGRRYVARTAELFDVVLVSARPPLSGQANRYHTREFYAAVSRVLRPGGSMTVTAPGGANVLAPEAARAAASTLATVGSVFSEVVIVPGLRIGVHAASQPGVVSDDPELLAARFDERGVLAEGFTARRFAPLLERSRIRALRAQLDRWPAAINTDQQPRAYLANLQLWERSLAERGETDDPTWTGFAERWAWLWLVVPLIAWAIWRAVRLARRSADPSADAVFAIATTGAAGMATEVVVLYAYQAASGQLYTGLALLVGLFMAGLAAGAFLVRRVLDRAPRWQGLVVDGAALSLLLASGPALSGALQLPWLIAAWSAVAGAVTGAAFPALLALAARTRGGDERRAAARIEAADHLGAALGALVTGVIWLPIFGITRTCLLFAAIKAASLLGLIPSVRRVGRIDQPTA
jgi:spermidine synthase